jgi:hypothetical protein
MILVAFMAAGFALARFGPNTDWSRPESRWYHAVRDFLAFRFTVLLSLMNLAIIPLRLRGPRTRSLRRIRQPGMAAACAVAVVLSMTALGSFASVMTHAKYWPTNVILETFWLRNGYLIAPTVALVWLTLVIQRRWQPGRDWVDRLGIVIGLAWIIIVMPWPVAPWVGLAIARLTGGGTLL